MSSAVVSCRTEGCVASVAPSFASDIPPTAGFPMSDAPTHPAGHLYGYLSNNNLLALNVLARDRGSLGKANLNASFDTLAQRLTDQLGMSEAGSPRCVVAGNKRIPRMAADQDITRLLESGDHQTSVAARVAFYIDRIAHLRFVTDTFTPDRTPWRERLQSMQTELSKLLLEFPVLLDPRVVIGVLTQDFNVEFMPVAHAIAQTGLARLPTARDGVSEEVLSAFAASHCVQRGLAAPAPNINDRTDGVVSGKTTGLTPVRVAAKNKDATGRIFSAGSPYLTSWVETVARVAGFPARTLPLEERESGMDALGAGFWGVITSNATDSDRADFVRALRCPYPFRKGTGNDEARGAAEGVNNTTALGLAQSTAGASMPAPKGEPLIESGDFLHALSKGACYGLFHDEPVPDIGSPSIPASSTIAAQTQRAIEMLHESGAVNSRAAAAAWLAHVTLGYRNMWDKLPASTIDNATTFLGVLARNGVLVRSSNDTDSEPLAGIAMEMNAKEHSGDGADTWEIALGVSTTHTVMAATIAAAAVDQDAINIVAMPKDEPTAGRRRRMGV
jgi:hypothetical protein